MSAPPMPPPCWVCSPTYHMAAWHWNKVLKLEWQALNLRSYHLRSWLVSCNFHCLCSPGSISAQTHPQVFWLPGTPPFFFIQSYFWFSSWLGHFRSHVQSLGKLNCILISCLFPVLILVTWNLKKKTRKKTNTTLMIENRTLSNLSNKSRGGSLAELLGGTKVKWTNLVIIKIASPGHPPCLRILWINSHVFRPSKKYMEQNLLLSNFPRHRCE